tara:strand:- start:170 stop:1279 length:1110 start_codon:yes stop_codon:yes gene_type:complete
MKAIQSEYYGDNHRWFLGVVDSIDDPKTLGRIRVRVFGLHTENTNDIKPSDLPWASVVLPVTQGGVGGSTQPTGIQPGARVYGIFLDGEHSQNPLVLGSIPHNSDYRVTFEEDVDIYIPTNKTSSVFEAGDPITAEVNDALEAAGLARKETGGVLTQEDADNLNGTGISENTTLVGSGRQEQGYNYLRAWFIGRGSVDPGIHAAAFIGNFMNESGPNIPPNAGPNFTDTETGQKYAGVHTRWGQENSFGIAQWNKSAGRFDELRDYANQRTPRKTWQDFLVQLEFVTWELQNTHTYVLKKIMNTSTIPDATAVVLRYYEVPEVAVNYNKYQSNRSEISASRQSDIVRKYEQELQKRLSAAAKVFEEFGG